MFGGGVIGGRGCGSGLLGLVSGSGFSGGSWGDGDGCGAGGPKFGIQEGMSGLEPPAPLPGDDVPIFIFVCLRLFLPYPVRPYYFLGLTNSLVIY